jgi:hypothetical protein
MTGCAGGHKRVVHTKSMSTTRSQGAGEDALFLRGRVSCPGGKTPHLKRQLRCYVRTRAYAHAKEAAKPGPLA